MHGIGPSSWVRKHTLRRLSPRGILPRGGESAPRWMGTSTKIRHGRRVNASRPRASEVRSGCLNHVRTPASEGPCFQVSMTAGCVAYPQPSPDLAAIASSLMGWPSARGSRRVEVRRHTSNSAHALRVNNALSQRIVTRCVSGGARRAQARGAHVCKVTTRSVPGPSGGVSHSAGAPARVFQVTAS
jgi:hypothetical protein